MHFKLADTAEEFEAIHRLNYRTFAEEIPQHAQNEAGRLVDRFHAENVYAVCVAEGAVVGMIAGRSQRPFSLDQKLEDLDQHLPPHGLVVEVRLLAVAPAYRKQAVFARLAGVLARHFRAQGFDLAVISGTTRELALYAHLGFQPFGPRVGSAEAPYQPMFLSLARYAAQAAHLEPLGGAAMQRLLPRPVRLRPAVAAALAQPALSHRSEAFMAVHRRVCARLAALGGEGLNALLMAGSGTTANDAVAAQLSLTGGRGLILSNGEFGERLQDHGRRWRLDFDVLAADWGHGFEAAQLAQTVERLRPRWIWLAACETSTGVRNPVEALALLCRPLGIALCVDAVSALGLQPLDLRGVRLASAVSGKALGSAGGLAVVLHDGQLLGAGQLPASFDLAGCYVAAEGVPFTQNSALVAALDAALDIDWPARWAAIRAADALLRIRLRAVGLAPLAADADAMPGVITLAPACSAEKLAQRMARAGFELAHRSHYLRQRNWLQICLMGEWEVRRLELLPEALARYQGSRSPL